MYRIFAFASGKYKKKCGCGCLKKLCKPRKISRNTKKFEKTEE